MRRAERDRYAGRAGLSVRLVLRALGNAGQKTGRRHLAFGVRSLAIAAGLSRITVAVVLRQLRDELDPLLVDLVDGRGQHGDLYELRIPDSYLQQARALMRGGPAGSRRCCRASGCWGYRQHWCTRTWTGTHRTAGSLAHTALLSVRATQQALVEFAAHGLADRSGTGWRRGAAAPPVGRP